MSRKDFRLIAAAIYTARQRAADNEPDRARAELCGIADVAREIAHSLQATNPRFDRERFLRACETGRD